MKYIVTNSLSIQRNWKIGHTILGTVLAPSRLEAIDRFVEEHKIEWYRSGLRAAWIKCEAAEILLSRLITKEIHNQLLKEETSHIFYLFTKEPNENFI